MARSYVRGGGNLKRFLQNAKKSSSTKQASAEAGFLEPHVARLAARLEFGDVRSSLPERPAFRLAKADAGKAGARVVAKALSARVREGVFVVDEAHARAAADAMADKIADSLPHLPRCADIRTPGSTQGRHSWRRPPARRPRRPEADPPYQRPRRAGPLMARVCLEALNGTVRDACGAADRSGAKTLRDRRNPVSGA